MLPGHWPRVSSVLATTAAMLLRLFIEAVRIIAAGRMRDVDDDEHGIPHQQVWLGPHQLVVDAAEFEVDLKSEVRKIGAIRIKVWSPRHLSASTLRHPPGQQRLQRGRGAGNGMPTTPQPYPDKAINLDFRPITSATATAVQRASSRSLRRRI